MEGEPRIGVYFYHCGSNVAATVDVKEVAELGYSLNVTISGNANVELSFSAT